MTVAEELILGLQTLVLGMAVTFVGLAVLQIIMILMGRASDRNRVAVTSKVRKGWKCQRSRGSCASRR